MQSQEGRYNTPEQAVSAERNINADPSEQQQWQVPRQQNAQRPYAERAYEEGYGGLDTGDTWFSEGEKILPKPPRRLGMEGLVLFLLLLCALVIAGSIFGIIVSWLSWSLIVGLVCFGAFAAIMSWRVVTVPEPVQSFQVMEHPRLVVNNAMGTVFLHRGEQGVITVAPTKRASGIRATPGKMQVQYGIRDNTLNIATQVSWNIFQLGLRSIDLDITVPESCDVQLNNGSGRVIMQDVTGQFRVRTGSGRVEASGLRGRMDVKTGSGRITASGLQGQVALKTGSGRIEIGQTLLAGNSQFKTGSGSITFEGALDPLGSYDLRTGSGPVRLMLPPDAAFNLKASTGTGSVFNEFGSPQVGRGPQAQLRVKTGSGGVYVARGMYQR